MKWKYADHLTADFRFKFTPTGHAAMVGGVNGKEEEWVGFNLAEPSDWDRLTSDMASTANPAEAIIECGYHTESKKWTYVLLRTDKSRPNHKNVVLNVLKAIDENITLSELVAIVPANPSQGPPEISDKKSKQDESPGSAVDLPSTPIESPIQYQPNASPGPSLFASSHNPALSSSSETAENVSPVVLEQNKLL